MDNDTNIYTGCTTLELTDDEIAWYFGGLYDLPPLKQNEYLLVLNDKGELVDKRCYARDTWRTIRYPSVTLGNEIIAPRNHYQAFAIDLLLNRDVPVKLLRGVYGSGKDLLMTAAAIAAVKQGQFERIVFIRPNVTVANVPDIGYLPGDADEKLAWTLGPIEDNVGGAERLKTLLSKGTISPIPLAFIRGRSFNNSIVYVTEGQNMTTEIVKLLLGRVGSNSELWINGDSHQSDKRVFEQDNGLDHMVDCLAGNDLFGYVYLPITERSDVANLANLLD